MLGSIERMAEKSAAINPLIAEVAIASRKHLTEEQKNAVRHLTAAPDASTPAGRAAASLGSLADGEDHLAALIVGAGVPVAADAEGVIQQAG